MAITVSSIFRNSTGYLPRYFGQIAALREQTDVRLVLGEGDSNDQTGDMLRAMVDNHDTVITLDHGGPHFGSIDHPQRWANIAKVVRAVIEQVDDPGDAFVYVESDLAWNPETIVGLIDRKRPVCPMILAGDTTRFYDTFSYRMEGRMFNPQPPYFPVPVELHEVFPVTRIDSCGSCFVLPHDEFRLARRWDGFWPFPAAGHLWLDTTAIVRHP